MNFLSRIFSGWSWNSPSSARRRRETEISSEASTSSSFSQIPPSRDRSTSHQFGFSFSGHSKERLLSQSHDFSSEVTDAAPTKLIIPLDIKKLFNELGKVSSRSGNQKLIEQSEELLGCFAGWWAYGEQSELENNSNKSEQVFLAALDRLEDTLKTDPPSSAFNIFSNWKTACQKYAFTLALAKQERAAFNALGPMTKAKKDSQAREAFIQHEQRANRLETEAHQLRELVAAKSQHFFTELCNHLETLVRNQEHPGNELRDKENLLTSLEADHDSEKSMNHAVSFLEQSPIVEPPIIKHDLKEQHLKIEEHDKNRESTLNLEELLSLSLMQARQRRRAVERDPLLLRHPTGARLLNCFLPNDSNQKKIRTLVEFMVKAQEHLKQRTQALEKNLGDPQLNKDVQDAEYVVKEVEDALMTVREEMERVAEETHQSDAVRLEREQKEFEEKINTHAQASSVTPTPRPASYVQTQHSQLTGDLAEEIVARKNLNQPGSGKELLQSLENALTPKGKYIKKQLLEQELVQLKNYSQTFISLRNRQAVEHEVDAALTLLSQEN